MKYDEELINRGKSIPHPNREILIWKNSYPVKCAGLKHIRMCRPIANPVLMKNPDIAIGYSLQSKSICPDMGVWLPFVYFVFFLVSLGS